MDAVTRQRAYYADSATRYDLMHMEDEEHNIALDFMLSSIRRHKIKSVLDIGSGTGRAIMRVKSEMPDVRIVGIEPSKELRSVGHLKGIAQSDLIDGNAQSIEFQSGSFDLVCSFGVLHHVPNPDKAVAEMLRVANRAVFISDHNDIARGSTTTTIAKRMIKACGMWPLYKLLVSKGNGYRFSEDDGIWYNYSIFDSYKLARAAKCDVHFLSTKPSAPNLPAAASHAAMLCLKTSVKLSRRREHYFRA